MGCFSTHYGAFQGFVSSEMFFIYSFKIIEPHSSPGKNANVKDMYVCTELCFVWSCIYCMYECIYRIILKGKKEKFKGIVRWPTGANAL